MKKNISFILLFTGGIILGVMLSLGTITFINNYKNSNDNNDKVIQGKKEESGYVIYFDDDGKQIDDYDYGKVKEDDLKIENNYVVEEEDSKETPVEYFSKVENSSNENVLKKGFVTIVDFIFYDEPINGYTFKGLTSEAKLKIMKIALSIDNKIEEYFPGYKETISNGAKKVYSNIKGFVVELYLDTTTMICKNNASVCQNAKEDFAYMKKSFGITWDLIKSLAEAGTEKLKEWYEIFRG